MRYLFTLLFFLFAALLIQNVKAQVPSYVPTSSLLAYYSYNGNANDLSGNGVNGTVTGATFTTDRFGNSNAAVNFTGSSERITTHKIDKVTTNSFSYSAWVYPLNSATIPTQGGSGGLSTSQSYTCVIAPVDGWYWSSSGTATAAGLNVATNGVYVTEHGNGITKCALAWSGTLTGWHHIVIVYSSKTPSLYIDGTFIQNGVTSSYTVHPSMGCDSFNLGGTYPYLNAGFGHGLYPISVPTYNFSGKIDDIAIYGRAITPCEITELHDTMTYTIPTVTGASWICGGATTTFTSSIGGGTWVSSNSGVATVDTAGVVTGTGSGMAMISYVISGGCLGSAPISVNALPPIIGPTVVCLSDAPPTFVTGATGGSWSSSNTSVATINAVSGVLTGVTAGSTTLSYTNTAGCYTTLTVTVMSTVPSITGTLTACTGTTTTLSNSMPTGVWSSASLTVATVGSTSGIVSCISSGTDTIFYTIGTSCVANAIVTVSASPPSITGTRTVCSGLTTTLSNSFTGGVWTSLSTGVATIGSLTGVVSGISSGTTTIAYNVGGCGTSTTVTVYATPTSISGTPVVCSGFTTPLSISTTGGSWSSGSTSVATTGTTGIVTGVATGTAIITYATSSTCFSTVTVTVNGSPVSISGVAPVCTGQSLTLTDGTIGGTWLSQNPSVGTIGSSTGVVTAIAAGNDTISYVLPTGCYAMAAVTINPLPAAISGTAVACVGATTALSDASSGGRWTSSSTGIAAVGSISGIVTGVSAGTSVISYILPTGCATSLVVTVNPAPTSITGASIVCAGDTTTLSDLTGGGTWQSGSPGIAIIGSTTGIATGISGGTAVITYSLPTGCFAVKTITVGIVPAAITGASGVCLGSTTVLSCSTGGGAWASGSSAIATAGYSTGVISGVALGVAAITYSMPTGCLTTATVTVNPVPGPITGTPAICVGAATTLADASPGGIWSSAYPGIASIGSATGFVSGTTAGITSVFYTYPATGCYAAVLVTVNPAPTGIAGIFEICQGTSTVISGIPAGGSWSSGSPGVATIGVLSGVINGIVAGITTITYTGVSGCSLTTVFTVDPLPAAITGTIGTCVGSGSALSDATPGGYWTSSNPTIATVGVTSGFVSGLAAGTSAISYTLSPSGCQATVIITVDPLPAPIGGITTICAGTTSTLVSPSPGGAWSSSAPSIAAVGSLTGDVSGYIAGTATISYTIPTGCVVTASVTVNPGPSAISGSTGLCLGSTSALTDSISGGFWSSSNPSIASVTPGTGIVSGIAVGSAIITYTLPSGCFTTVTVTVNSSLAPITGSNHLCVGRDTTLSDVTAGGSWSSGATSVATINPATGLCYGVSAGTAIISYSLGSGCLSTYAVTVNSSPLPVTGTTHVCTGGTVTLSDPAFGGIWSSSSPAVAIIGSATGIVIGGTPGTTTIYYVVSGCPAVATFTVNPAPAPVTGTNHICITSAGSLTDATTGGVWSSSSPMVASIGSVTGIVTGVAASTAIIIYTLPTGCYTTFPVTVNPNPATVTGASTLCPGATTTLACGTPGGSWSTGSSIVAIVGPLTGVVTGVSGGTANISYTLPTGCFAVKAITVNSASSPIAGVLTTCPLATTTLTNTTPGGLWTSGTASIASIGSLTGVVTGISAGTTVITYSVGAGCYATATVTVNNIPSLFSVTGGGSYCTGGTGLHVGLSGSVAGTAYQLFFGVAPSGAPVTGTGAPIDFGLQASAGSYTVVATNASGCNRTMPGSAVITVNPLPGAIGGASALCAGSTLTVTSTPGGGYWSSSAPAVAAVGSSSGLVTAGTIGTASITYTLSTGCFASKILTVSTAPTPVSGSSTVCTGNTTNLTDGVGGGVWSCTSSAASVGSLSGMVTGVAGGTAVISYSLGAMCTVTKTVTVLASPAAITGTATVCAGSTVTLHDATVGGVWLSSAPLTASVGSSTGIVSGYAAGVSIVTYLSGGCSTTLPITVNPIPLAITGTFTVCTGSATTVYDATPGGTWSTTPGVITIGSLTGTVTGIAAGTAVVTYSTGGCIAVRTVTVNTTPAISGASAVCVGSSVTLTGTGTGTWSSSAGSTAAIGSATGLLIGMSAGTAPVTFTASNGCFAVRVVTISSGPAAITGASGVCVGSSTTLTSSTTGGTWASSSTAIALIGSATGIARGITSGSATITYSVGSGCMTTRMITVNNLPPTIAGPVVVCSGATGTLTTGTTGTWSSSNSAIAAIGPTTGIITGGTPGTASITFTNTAGCTTTTTVTVTAPPAAITGSSTLCMGSSIMLTDISVGGTWSSSNPIIAMAGFASGIITGINSGFAVITYSTGAGCIATKIVTVNLPPPGISGPGRVCAGSFITLTDPAIGGFWSSGNTSVATAGSLTGAVIGVAGGITTISYTVSEGCSAVYTVTVNSVPPITGLTNLCAWGDTVTVREADITGLYSCTLVTVLNMGSGTARATSSVPGTSTITYTLASGCTTTSSLTVNPLPAGITGPLNVCSGNTSLMRDTTTGGRWSSSNSSIVTIGSVSGMVTGISTGIAYVTYTLPTGCRTDTPIHVNPIPATITGWGGTITIGTSTTYADATPGGIWSCSNPAIAAIGIGSGTVTGLSAGTVNISYSSSLGCSAVRAVTVTALSGARTGYSGFDCNGIKIMPNPNSGIFTINGALENFDKLTPSSETTVYLVISDIIGKTILSGKIQSVNGWINSVVELGSQIPDGTYFLKLTAEQETHIFTVIVQRK